MRGTHLLTPKSKKFKNRAWKSIWHLTLLWQSRRCPTIRQSRHTTFILKLHPKLVYVAKDSPKILTPPPCSYFLSSGIMGLLGFKFRVFHTASEYSTKWATPPGPLLFLKATGAAKVPTPRISSNPYFLFVAPLLETRIFDFEVWLQPIIFGGTPSNHYLFLPSDSLKKKKHLHAIPASSRETYLMNFISISSLAWTHILTLNGRKQM